MRRPEELRGRLVVHFQGEEGIDAGGLTREWYQLLSRVIFDKGTLLFTSAAGNDSTYQPNPNSGYQTEHLSYFKFVGRVVSSADLGFHGRLGLDYRIFWLECWFSFGWLWGGVDSAGCWVVYASCVVFGALSVWLACSFC